MRSRSASAVYAGSASALVVAGLMLRTIGAMFSIDF